MSDENISKENVEESLNPKEKFREALERKKKSGGIRNNNIAGNSKIHGDQMGGGAPKMFRRKSGSA
jgi:predicted nucleotidyltransferase